MHPLVRPGSGQEFSARHQNNWGKITADEIIARTKAFLKAHPFVDAQRVGCMGSLLRWIHNHVPANPHGHPISHAGISSISVTARGVKAIISTNASAHAFPWNRKGHLPVDKVKNPHAFVVARYGRCKAYWVKVSSSTPH